MIDFGTKLFTWFKGEEVGKDQFGNRYFQERREPSEGRRKRWVMYKGRPEASKVPPAWHTWLHYTIDNPPTEAEQMPQYGWQQEHLPNLTGTELKYVPPGHILRGAQREPSTSDYEAWKPE